VRICRGILSPCRIPLDEYLIEVPPIPSPPATRLALLYHFCRMQLPAVTLGFDRFQRNLERTFAIFRDKTAPELTWESYLGNLYPLDWYLCCGCLDGDNRAWEVLFATRTGRSDCLLIDALRARAVRLYPRDEERQENAVAEFWSHLLVSETPGSVPVLARYDGQRPLAPWLIRVFQNWHVSHLRSHAGTQALPEDDIAMPLPERGNGEGRWHDTFRIAARDWLAELNDAELLLLGLRWRYRLSQREVAQLLGVHEGTISRQTDKLRDHALQMIGEKLVSEGWSGDDLQGFVLTEMGSLLVDEPRLSADQLTALLKKRGIDGPSVAAAASP
jgi:RNA polymerase sigma factor (sigma-70 family)